MLKVEEKSEEKSNAETRRAQRRGREEEDGEDRVGQPPAKTEFVQGCETGRASSDACGRSRRPRLQDLA
jgi:hypothetical protein